MSAFLCSDFHTAVCALAASRHGLTKQSPKALYSAFRSANNKALAYRYGDKAQPAQRMALYLRRADAYLDRATVADVAQLFACLVYQCSEGKTMETHRAAPLLNKAGAHFTKLANGKTSHVWSI